MKTLLFAIILTLTLSASAAAQLTGNPQRPAPQTEQPAAADLFERFIQEADSLNIPRADYLMLQAQLEQNRNQQEQAKHLRQIARMQTAQVAISIIILVIGVAAVSG